jgi:hypothetical protein
MWCAKTSLFDGGGDPGGLGGTIVECGLYVLFDKFGTGTALVGC